MYITIFYKILKVPKNSTQNLNFWLIFRGFLITPSYALSVTPQFLCQIKFLMEMHNPDKFHLYNISGCKVKKFEILSWWWSIHEMTLFWGFWALTPPNVIRFCWNLHHSYYSRRVRHCFKFFLKIQVLTEIGRSQSVHFF